MLGNIWTILQIVIDLFFKLSDEIRKSIGQTVLRGIIYSIMGLSLYVLINVIHEHGNFSKGFDLAFYGPVFESKQDELRMAAKTDKLITEVLQTVLHANPSVSKIKLALIHNGVTGITGIAMLHFDTISSVAKTGRDVGPNITNGQLSDWSDFIQSLINGKCQMVEVSKMNNPVAKVRIEGSAISSFYACPVVDVQGQILGALFASWEITDVLPSGSALAVMETQMLTAGRQVGAAMDVTNIH